jgi:ankyrin repeat protein
VKRLIDAGAPVSQADRDGNTPLHHAVQERDTELIQLLLKAKAKKDAANQLGQTPLAIAIQNQDKTAIELLGGPKTL